VQTSLQFGGPVRFAHHQPGCNDVTKSARIIVRVWQESRTLITAALDLRSCLLTKLAIAAGLGYLFGPLDLIPDRIPIFGHFDEAGFILGGLVLGRVLVPRSVADGQDWHSNPLWPQRQHSWRRIRAKGLHPFVLLGYRRWWILLSPFARHRSSSQCLIVIGGAARSGTTLVRSILARHPLIVSGPETTVFLRRISSPETLGERLGWNPSTIERWQRQSRSQVEFIERIQHAMLEQSGKLFWAEKTPANVMRFRFVRRCFPHAKLIHVIRDGRDTACSLRGKGFAKIGDAPRDSAEAARRCAVMWKVAVKTGLRHRSDPAYYELRYEDLVFDPEPTLRRLCDFLQVPWSPGLTEPASDGGDWSRSPRSRWDSFAADERRASAAIFHHSIGRWQHDLSPIDIEVLRPVIGPLLVELGYEHGLDWTGGEGHAAQPAAYPFRAPNVRPATMYRRSAK
jgi:protein-tyrosine sulfotransferase